MLVTDVAYDLNAIGQLYRDRCDCENGFNELKNQWGWGGFSTQVMHRSELTAWVVALVYNWWNWYVRAANPQAQAHVRRAAEQLPKLNRWHSLVGYICESIAGQTVLPTPPHALQGAR